MRKLVLGLMGAAALAIGTAPANATTTYDGINGAALEANTSEFFGATITGEPGSFLHTFNFTLTDEWFTNGHVGSILLFGNDIDFSGIWLDTFAFDQVGFDPSAEVWQLSPHVTLGAGPHTVTVRGSTAANGNGSYSGTLNVAPVPEPATWAMMLLGFGAIGFAMRRRARPALAQIA